MDVRRLLIADHPLLSDAVALLEELELPAPPYQVRGDWRADIAAGPPLEERFGAQAFLHKSIHAPRPLVLPSDCMVSAIEFYPPGGAGLGWHTDARDPGWRIYIPRPLAEVAGVFLVPAASYPDEPGVANAFLISGRRCDSWHAVRADGPRLSIGLRIGPTTARELGLD